MFGQLSRSRLLAEFMLALQLKPLISLNTLLSGKHLTVLFGCDSHFAVSCWEHCLFILLIKCFDSSHDKKFQRKFFNSLCHRITMLTFSCHRQKSESALMEIIQRCHLSLSQFIKKNTTRASSTIRRLTFYMSLLSVDY